MDIINVAMMVVLVVLLTMFFNISNIYVWLRDMHLLYNYRTLNIVEILQNNNKKIIPKNKKNKILIITYDNRNDDYIQLHNANFINYCNKWGIDYEYYDKCNLNVYWCKMYMLNKSIDKYDYVMWCDSDTIIKNDDIDLNDIINQYDADIIMSDDNVNVVKRTNAGIFIIKNSIIGKQFLQDCIKTYEERKKHCYVNNNKLNGIWALSCYEQGVMDELLFKKYMKYASLVPVNLFHNSGVCNDEIFLMHNYGTNSENRKKCFLSKKQNLS